MGLVLPESFDTTGVAGFLNRGASAIKEQVMLEARETDEIVEGIINIPVRVRNAVRDAIFWL